MFGKVIAPRQNIAPSVYAFQSNISSSIQSSSNTHDGPPTQSSLQPHNTSTKLIPSTSFKPLVTRRDIDHVSNSSNKLLPPTKTNDPIAVRHKPKSDDNSKIRVVIRIRPMSVKEVEKGSKYVLEPIASGNQIKVWDPVSLDIVNRMDVNTSSTLDSSFWYRVYSFDRCLWSLSPDIQSNDNINTRAITAIASTQDDVFNDVGKPVLEWILGGYNCSVIAFGQTGAGKSFTMMGNIAGDDAESFGLIPRICFGLFDELDAADSRIGGQGYGDGMTVDTSDEVLFSHLEIYNETIRDLLVEPMYRPLGGNSNHNNTVRLREHPQKGVFVAGLTTIRVTSFEEVMSLIAIGESNRTVAATNSNLHSSRSHAIVTLTVNRRVRHGSKHGLPTAGIELKSSLVHLVDLAGSERVTLSGAEGTRLKEANNINRSLSVLGDVIKCLGDQSKGSKGHVPYRNSTLTMVLRDSLGGNSHAVMITAVSPSSNDYEETVSSLKYAERAKRVRMRVEANVTSGLQAASDASALELVPILQAEVQKLREMLRQQQLQQQQRRPYNDLGDLGTNISWDNHNSNKMKESPSRRPNGSVTHSISNGDHEDAILSGEMMKEMQDRVNELEKQLEDREKLIQSLKFSSVTSIPSLASLSSQSIDTNHSSQTTHIDNETTNHSHVLAIPMDLQSPNNNNSSNNSNSNSTHKKSSSNVTITGGNQSSINPKMIQISNTSNISPSISNTMTSAPSSSMKPKILATPPRQSAVAVAAAVSGLKGRPLVVLADDSVDKRLPRMLNLNQDPLFSECLVYYLPPGHLTAGNNESEVDILLTGPDILPLHCHIISSFNTYTNNSTNGSINTSTSSKNNVMISLIGSNTPLLFVNGQQITKSNSPVILNHHDRIAFGRFHLFRFEDGEQSSTGEIGFIPGWEYAHEELLTKSGAIMNVRHQMNWLPSQGNNNGQGPVVGMSQPNGLYSANGMGSVNNLVTPISPTNYSPKGKSQLVGSNTTADVWTMNNFRQQRVNQQLFFNGQTNGSNSHLPMSLSPRKSDQTPVNISISNTTVSSLIDNNSNNRSDITSISSPETTLLVNEPKSVTIPKNNMVTTDTKPSPLMKESVLLRTPSSEEVILSTPLRKQEKEKVLLIEKSPAIVVGNNGSETGSESGTNSSFEAEALALQQELSQMQVALQERMQRYRRLSSSESIQSSNTSILKTSK